MTREMNEEEAGDRLRDGRGRGEHIVGDDHRPQGRRNSGRRFIALRPEQKEGDAETGAEQDCAAEHMYRAEPGQAGIGTALSVILNVGPRHPS
jgi:hypothetical protein